MVIKIEIITQKARVEVTRTFDDNDNNIIGKTDRAITIALDVIREPKE